MSRDRERAFTLAQDTVTHLFGAYAANARERTYEAIQVEWAAPIDTSTHGAVRGRPAGPPNNRVNEAFRLQSEDAIAMLGSRMR